MNCPRCEAARLDELETNGIPVDLCSRCRGVWLDPGELEELVALAALEVLDEAARRKGASPRPVGFHAGPPGGVRLHPPLRLDFD